MKDAAQQVRGGGGHIKPAWWTRAAGEQHGMDQGTAATHVLGHQPSVVRLE